MKCITSGYIIIAAVKYENEVCVLRVLVKKQDNKKMLHSTIKIVCHWF